MARVPKLLDVSVPLRQGLRTYPNNPQGAAASGPARVILKR